MSVAMGAVRPFIRSARYLTLGGGGVPGGYLAQ